MPDIAAIVQTGAANPWLYLPLAILLGALHALEPGHSKSLMAAFIVTTRGTPAQAALLGLSAAIGHTLVVWALAALGLFLGDKLILEKAEPWLILVSGLLIIGLAIRIWWLFRAGEDHHDHDHAHVHRHDHDHAHRHDHEHSHGATAPKPLSHDEAHASDIRSRFANKKVTNLDIAWFGLTGGLLPCPSAIAVLLICIQLKAFVLGFAMVAGFSIGLAITLISVGVLAAWGAKRASEGWSGFSRWSAKLPLLSALIVGLVGVLIVLRGLQALGWIPGLKS